ncbi:MAG: UDP-N-acetylmuramoyl-L-alanine--D-glutamate ligase [Sulfobacillus acidophilus]|uniref:UDP-N-acetylmuramoylalanine--D-glutamate ligase n=1 Tax=Sulfobacillus acidophilus TaxID=53633 RepID=A0A2T2WDG5_9FIRM|nr:MAG: UDP-N-acetylmuramoyl-L-alanine--D-glutamate ligase [Sulfobacillus acidophilus]
MSSSDLVGVVGLGVSNRPLVSFLLDQGQEVAVFDRRPGEALMAELEDLGATGVEVYGGPQYLQALLQRPLSTVYLTPGVPKFGPELDELRKRGVRFSCETELFLERCQAPVIGITGSAGKTTTTTLVGESLRRDGRRPVYVGGNIGQPLISQLGQIGPESWVVLELSSFQLDLTKRSPHGACILNIRPNHLDIHRDYQDYKEAKANIARFQSKEDWVVLPYDDAEVTAMVAQGTGRRVFFSLSQEIAHGAYYRDQKLWWRGGKGARPVVDRSALKLIGEHNVANALAAIAIVASAGGDLEAAAAVLESFAGVPHRLEVVREVNDVLYINDSIATAPDRTMAALAAISRPIVLILGGYDKKLDYDTLGEALRHSRVHTVVVLGEIRDRVKKAVMAHTDIPVIEAQSFDQAVQQAAVAARPGDVVLLSPATASYDLFANFEERGKRFRELVGRLNANGSGFQQ